MNTNDESCRRGSARSQVFLPNELEFTTNTLGLPRKQCKTHRRIRRSVSSVRSSPGGCCCSLVITDCHTLRYRGDIIWRLETTCVGTATTAHAAACAASRGSSGAICVGGYGGMDGINFCMSFHRKWHCVHKPVSTIAVAAIMASTATETANIHPRQLLTRQV